VCVHIRLHLLYVYKLTKTHTDTSSFIEQFLHFLTAFHFSGCSTLVFFLCFEVSRFLHLRAFLQQKAPPAATAAPAAVDDDKDDGTTFLEDEDVIVTPIVATHSQLAIILPVCVFHCLCFALPAFLIFLCPYVLACCFFFVFASFVSLRVHLPHSSRQENAYATSIAHK